MSNINHPNNTQTSPPSPSTTTTITTSRNGRGPRGQSCAACRFQRRKCPPGCVLAPYFPQTNPTQFNNAHKVFGVSNMIKTLQSLDPIDRQTAAESLIYEANVRAADPIGGCHRIIRELRRRIVNYEALIGFLHHRPEMQSPNFGSQEQELRNPNFSLDINGCVLRYQPENYGAQEQESQNPNSGLDINGCFISHWPQNFSSQEQEIQNSNLGGSDNSGFCYPVPHNCNQEL